MTSPEIEELLKDATYISFVACTRVVYLIFPNEYESEDLYNGLVNFFGDRPLTIQIRRGDDGSVDFYLGDANDFVSAKGLVEKVIRQSLDDFTLNERENVEWELGLWPIELFVVNLSFNIYSGESSVDMNLHFRDQQYKKLTIRNFEVL